MVSTEIIAEIGINHGGDIKLAHELIDLAAKAGAKTIKFQMVNPDLVYFKKDRLYEIFDKARFTKEQWRELKHDVENRFLKFLCTPGDRESVECLEELGVDRYKIASDSAKRIDFVNDILAKKKPVLISTGEMSSVNEILRYISTYNRAPDAVLHCVSKYPVEPEDANLRRISLLKKHEDEYGFITGYSDHTRGYEASLVAVSLGARIIEKHIKKTDDCIDAKVSLFPEDFETMVREINRIDRLL